MNTYVSLFRTRNTEPETSNSNLHRGSELFDALTPSSELEKDSRSTHFTLLLYILYQNTPEILFYVSL